MVNPGNTLPASQEGALPPDEAMYAVDTATLAEVTGVPDNGWELEQHESERAFHVQLEQIGNHVPEAAQEAELITRGAGQLIEAFRVNPEFFKDRNRSTIFTSLALGAARVEDAIAQQRGDRKENERKQAFIANAAFLLTRKYAANFPELIAEHETQAHEGHDGMRKSAMDKFEQPELTRSLRTYIDREGVLDDIRTRFSGVGDEEPDYHVLSIGDTTASFHFDREANGISRQEAADWDKGLQERAKQFAQLVPGGDLAAKAAGFAVEFDDADGHHVYIPDAAAELLMAEERGIVPNESMVQLKGQRTKGTIKHEFAHTRNSLIVEGEFGKSVEERKAEYFSGDTGEYYEVKGFFTNLRVLHGHSIADIFEENLQSLHSEDPISVYELLGKYYGLETVAEIAASQPDAYVNHAKSSYTKEMLGSLGSFSEIIERDAKTTYVDQEEARGRLTAVVNMLRRNKLQADGSLDSSYEDFLNHYFGTASKALALPVSAIPFSTQ
jgi:hypothetical protein